MVVRSLVVLGPSDPPTRAAAAVLAALLDGEARTTLRSEETLGYVASVETFDPSTLDPGMDAAGLMCTVFPGRDSQHPLRVLARIADFWTHAPGRRVAACDAAELRRIVAAIVATRGPAAAPSERVAAERMWTDLMGGDPDGRAEIRALRALTPHGLRALVDHRLSDPSRRRRIAVAAAPDGRVVSSPDTKFDPNIDHRTSHPVWPKRIPSPFWPYTIES